MITVRRSAERHHRRGPRRQLLASFHASRSDDVFSLGFGALARFDEHRLETGASVELRPGPSIEVVSYVVDGLVTTRDSNQMLLRPGDFQRVSGGDGARLRQRNRSSRDAATILQLWFRCSSLELEPSSEQRRFSAAERRGILRLVASGDPSHDSLRIQSGVLIYSAILEPGHHLVHELGLRRSAWLHVVHGEALCDAATLLPGDAASFALERAVSFTALAPTEIVLVELAHLVTAPESRASE